MDSYVVYYHRQGCVEHARIQRFVEANFGRVAATVTEVDGTPQWPQLREAVEAACTKGATLVIADAGRMTRNFSALEILSKSGVHFVCCDQPNANALTVHILLAKAHDESVLRRERTRTSLVAAKARGVKLGSHREGHWDGKVRGWRQAVPAASLKRQQRAAEAYKYLLPEIKTRRERGDTLPEIIEWLNAQGHTTTVGKPFTEVALWRIIGRYLGKEYLGNNQRKCVRV